MAFGDDGWKMQEAPPAIGSCNTGVDLYYKRDRLETILADQASSTRIAMLSQRENSMRLFQQIGISHFFQKEQGPASEGR